MRVRAEIGESVRTLLGDGGLDEGGSSGRGKQSTSSRIWTYFERRTGITCSAFEREI